jgi:hypothetical protein
MDGTFSTNGEIRNAFKILVGKPKGKRPLGRLRHRCYDNMIMDFKERQESCGMDSSGSAEGQVAGCYEHGNEPRGSTKGGEFLDEPSD